MLDLIKDLPFSIETWKIISLLLLGAVIYFSKVYKDYDKLRNKTDGMVEDMSLELSKVSVSTKNLIDKIELINTTTANIQIQYEKMDNIIDNFIKVIITTDEISKTQKDHLEMFNNIIKHLQSANVCKMEEDSRGEFEDNQKIKELLKSLCQTYKI